jgi:phosphopentomutase
MRFVYLLLDGVGVGELPDAAEYGDVGANTLGNVARVIDLHLPHLAALGLGNILPLRGVLPATSPSALPGRLAEVSKGKDTTIGHWEHMGIETKRPFPSYPHGFPEEVLAPFREHIGRDVLGNVPASGTEIIARLGEEHLRTGYPIVYTSADSVFQIACHVDVCPLEQLYAWCAVAREILTGPHAVARVIARPFAGTPGAFVRTKDRKDFSLEPTGTTYLDLLVQRGIPIVGVGKIFQIFAGRGVTEEWKVASNDDNLARVTDFLESGRDGLLFSNLVDFDMAWGHRNDPEGFARGLEAVDRALPRLLAALAPEDRLLLTADHGVDPTTVGTDHTREYVPLLYYPGPAGAPPTCYQGMMADTGATAYTRLTGEEPPLGGRDVEALTPARGWRACPTVRALGHGRPLGTADACVVPVTHGDQEVAGAAAFLRERWGSAPTIAVVLGSGASGAVDLDPDEAGRLDGAQVPGWPQPSVAGHAGAISLGCVGGHGVVVVDGRVHLYEGRDLGAVQFAVRVLAGWGVQRVVLTNAAGSLRAGLAPGTVLSVDRILDFQVPELLGQAEDGPDEIRFAPVDPGGAPGITYAAVPGPQYETAAEVAVLGSLGADVVGMSAAAEIRAALDEGLRVAVLSVVTNAAAEVAPNIDARPDAGEAAAGVADTSADGAGGPSAHDGVLAAGRSALPQLRAAIEEVVRRWESGG